MDYRRKVAIERYRNNPMRLVERFRINMAVNSIRSLLRGAPRDVRRRLLCLPCEFGNETLGAREFQLRNSLLNHVLKAFR